MKRERARERWRKVNAAHSGNSSCNSVSPPIDGGRGLKRERERERERECGGESIESAL